MGINIPTKEELIANRPEFEDIAGDIGEIWNATKFMFLRVVPSRFTF